MIGIGMGLSMMALNTHVLQSAPRKLVSRVTPLTAAVQQVIMSFTAAGMVGFLASKITHYVATAANPLTALVSAYKDSFQFGAIIGLCGVVLALILRKPQKIKGDLNEKFELIRKESIHNIEFFTAN
jgi:hypothetical protein